MIPDLRQDCPEVLVSIQGSDGWAGFQQCLSARVQAQARVSGGSSALTPLFTLLDACTEGHAYLTDEEADVARGQLTKYISWVSLQGAETSSVVEFHSVVDVLGDNMLKFLTGGFEQLHKLFRSLDLHCAYTFHQRGASYMVLDSVSGGQRYTARQLILLNRVSPTASI
jgi:hypothetical protein